jgi:hypothetical protein
MPSGGHLIMTYANANTMRRELTKPSVAFPLRSRSDNEGRSGSLPMHGSSDSCFGSTIVELSAPEEYRALWRSLSQTSPPRRPANSLL